MHVKDTRTPIIAIEGSDIISDFAAAFSQMRLAFPSPGPFQRWAEYELRMLVIP
jgi:hypothetical protein